jgi:hypothetical protein
MSQLAERSTAPIWLHSAARTPSVPQSTFSDLAGPSTADMPWKVWHLGQSVSGHAKIQSRLGIGEPFHDVERAQPWRLAPIEAGSWLNGSSADLWQPIAVISTDCARFARQHGMWGSLLIVRSLILRHVDVVNALEVELVHDAEIQQFSTICFVIRTRAGLERALDLDEQLRTAVIDSIPAPHQGHIAVRFEFA